MSLSDMMLIKDNHLRQAGGISAALKKPANTSGLEINPISK